ncbi:DUF350 domain-containing protein [Nocardia cyriacigeorgica]|uniref:DUF350 domain-containing protein n=1 Tax=Nocardia cyriacigeorgica TaxID=135487 RepID=UPI003CC7E40E
MALAFLLLDLVTPGEFRGVVAEKELHPGVWVVFRPHPPPPPTYGGQCVWSGSSSGSPLGGTMRAQKVS